MTLHSIFKMVILSFIIQFNSIFPLVYGPKIIFKSTHMIYATNHTIFGLRSYVHLLVWYTNVWKVYFVSYLVGGVAVRIPVLPHSLINQKLHHISLKNTLCEAINLKVWRQFHSVKSDQQKSPGGFKKPSQPIFFKLCVI